MISKKNNILSESWLDWQRVDKLELICYYYGIKLENGLLKSDIIKRIIDNNINNDHAENIIYSNRNKKYAYICFGTINKTHVFFENVFDTTIYQVCSICKKKCRIMIKCNSFSFSFHRDRIENRVIETTMKDDETYYRKSMLEYIEKSEIQMHISSLSNLEVLQLCEYYEIQINVNNLEKKEIMDKIINNMMTMEDIKHLENMIYEMKGKKKTGTKTTGKKQKIPSAVRNSVWNKYIGTELKTGKCFCCQSESISTSNFNCGHIISEKDGGQVTLDNLRPICVSCNTSIGSKNMYEFMKKHGFKIMDNDEDIDPNSHEFRTAVWIKYSKNSKKCYLNCNTELTRTSFHSGLLVAKKDGGTNALTNVRMLCSSCYEAVKNCGIQKFLDKYDLCSE